MNHSRALLRTLGLAALCTVVFGASNAFAEQTGYTLQ